MNEAPAKNAGNHCASLLESYRLNERMNQMVLKALDPAAWRAQLPGSEVRTIAAIATHVHNVRRKWIRLSAPHLGLPQELHRASCTQEEARVAFEDSAARCLQLITEALCEAQSQVSVFRRDGWAAPWPAGAEMVAYMIAHEAHHRGQICMLARQLGFPLPVKIGSGMWAWERLTADGSLRRSSGIR